MAAATSEENEIVRAIDDGEEKKVQKWLKKRSSDIDMAITIADDDESVNCTMLMHVGRHADSLAGTLTAWQAR